MKRLLSIETAQEKGRGQEKTWVEVLVGLLHRRKW